MLSPIADGVLIHQSRFVQSNAVVVQGRDGVLLIDPGVHDDEMACLADDLHELGLPVLAGFSTHPHWDHLLWDRGSAPRPVSARHAARKPPDSNWRAGWPRSPGRRDPRPGPPRPPRPHHRTAGRGGAGPLGRPAGPVRPAFGARPGTCGAPD